MDYFFKPRALRQLKCLPKDVQKRIFDKLDFYCRQDDPLEFAEVLIHSDIGQYRFRVGDYRIIFDVEEEKMIILMVGHRREIYR